MSEMNRCMQKACVELKNISVQLGTMRKRMEEDERVRELGFFFQTEVCLISILLHCNSAVCAAEKSISFVWPFLPCLQSLLSCCLDTKVRI